MRTLLALPLLLALCLPGLAAADEGAEAVVPVKVVAGKLVVSCDLSTRFRRVPVTLFVELDAPCGLRLHNRAAMGIRAENRDGTPNAITIHLPDLDITVPTREHGPEKVYEDFTKFHAPEIGEVALVGTIGAEVLKKYHLTLDLHGGILRLAPPKARSEDAAEEVAGSVTTPVTLTNDLVWFTVQFADGKPGAMAVATSTFDTIVDTDVCEARGKPAGDIGTLTVGDLDLSKYVAFRPEEVVRIHKDGVAGTLGLNALQHLRVEIDRVNRFVRITKTRDAAFPVADLAFFRARAEDDGDAMQAFLAEHPKARLSREASHLLVNLRLDEGADKETVGQALTWVNDAELEDLRATTMLELMKKLAEAGHAEHVVTAGEIGIESGRKDRYPDAVHKIHGKLGEVLLEARKNREAWRHLLSAAFGLPEDGMINLNLGRFYERSGRLRRAYSRYVQAVIQPESGPQALAGLERLQSKMPGGERYSVDLVERLIGGKVLSFGTANKFKPTEKNTANRVVLLEFFTNAHLEAAIGGALGNEGILSHFPRKHVAALSYHLPAPQLEPLVNELALHTAQRRGVDRPVVHVIDGMDKGPGAARSDQKELVYNRLRGPLLEALKKPSRWSLELDAKVTGDVVSGVLRMKGPAREGLKLQVVCAERGVLFPGKSKVVIHRMVARGVLTGGLDGVAWKPVDGVMEIPFERSLADITKANLAWLADFEARGGGTVQKMAARIDPEQVTLVAFARGATGQIVQAIQLDPQVGK